MGMASSSPARQMQGQPENPFVEIAPYFAPKSTERWDIFINHYGRDVKYTLATDIYNILHSMGFNVFLDKDALEAGDSFPAEIQNAISSAFLHIAIFSPNYPQSQWCLNELSSMHKTGNKIIPIFYHVDPSDLRWIEEGKGWYAHVFSEHKTKGRYKAEQLHEWRGALYKCSLLHGYMVNNEKDKATVLKNIVNSAHKIMKKVQLRVLEHPLGFDELVQEIAPKSTEPWDIFISHRGRDVNCKLSNTIHHKLHSMGFRVFLDVETPEAGDSIPPEIQHAIISATVRIVIFSPKYAQSPWCLAQLSFMLKTGKKIVPIFCHVSPHDLRWFDQGKYAHAFSDHERKGRYKPEKLEEWKRAIHNSSFLSGYLVSNSEDEVIVLKNIVKFSLKSMKKSPLWVAEHLVGLDELVQGFESVAGEEEVKIKGIVGMGGSGKTTLAKELFNRNFSSFERSSFVSDVREAAARDSLAEKQKKLLSNLGVDYWQFDDVDEGKAILANYLRDHRALIVLDDVDDIEQLNALLPNKDKLGSKSMVIVTTRDLDVLRAWGLSHSIYKMPGLKESHAEQLFCWHAFLQSFPPAGFATLVKDFIKACNGSPLLLKVMGAQLYGRKSKDYWKSLLHKLLRILPSEIRHRLRASYDALDEEEREMFLDVACFFIGEKKSKAIAVWDILGWSGRYGLETLASRCLVELVKDEQDEGEERIMMHDHLIGMGREIASRHSPYRLLCAEQIDKMREYSTDEQLVQLMEEAQVDLLGKDAARAQSSGAWPCRAGELTVEGPVGERTAQDTIIVGLERDRDRLHVELDALRRQLAGVHEVCTEQKREMLKLQLDNNQSLVQELQAQVTKLSAERDRAVAESQRLCMDINVARRLLEGQSMVHAFTQLVEVATKLDRAHRESSYYRGLYERVVPTEQREPAFAEVSWAI